MDITWTLEKKISNASETHPDMCDRFRRGAADHRRVNYSLGRRPWSVSVSSSVHTNVTQQDTTASPQLLVTVILVFQKALQTFFFFSFPRLTMTLGTSGVNVPVRTEPLLGTSCSDSGVCAHAGSLAQCQSLWKNICQKWFSQREKEQLHT